MARGVAGNAVWGMQQGSFCQSFLLLSSFSILSSNPPVATPLNAEASQIDSIAVAIVLLATAATRTRHI